MKRFDNLFERVVSIENLMLADDLAAKGKSKQRGVIKHRKNREENLQKLHQTLVNGEYKTSLYTKFKIFDGKEREISKLPYFPDRIVQHAISNIIEPILVKTFTADTYSCIKGRGVHKASYNLRKGLKKGYRYCLKFDVVKFYPSVDNEVLKKIVRRKIKDARLLALMDEIIDSDRGLPIGSYLSQHLANLYMTYFDHFVKEKLRVKGYFRYADDVVVLSNSKQELWKWFIEMKSYLQRELRLEVKSNYQVFPVASRGIDWVGYVHYQHHTRLRKSIKQRYKKSNNKPGYKGWLVHANTLNLRKRYESKITRSLLVHGDCFKNRRSCVEYKPTGRCLAL